MKRSQLEYLNNNAFMIYGPDQPPGVAVLMSVAEFINYDGLFDEKTRREWLVHPERHMLTGPPPGYEEWEKDFEKEKRKPTNRAGLQGRDTK